MKWAVGLIIALFMVTSQQALSATGDEWVMKAAEETAQFVIQRAGVEQSFAQKRELNRVLLKAYRTIMLKKSSLKHVVELATTEYPDAFVFDATMRVFSIGALQPYLALSGRFDLIVLWQAVPILEMFTASYVVFRRWRKDIQYKNKFGYSLKEISGFKQDLFTSDSRPREDIEIDGELNKDIMELREKALISFSLASFGVETTLSVSYLESLLNDRDFLNVARRYSSTPRVYQQVLFEKILLENADRKSVMEMAHRLQLDLGRFPSEAHSLILEIQKEIDELIVTPRQETKNSLPGKILSPARNIIFNFKKKRVVKSLMDIQTAILLSIKANEPVHILTKRQQYNDVLARAKSSVRTCRIITNE